MTKLRTIIAVTIFICSFPLILIYLLLHRKKAFKTMYGDVYSLTIIDMDIYDEDWEKHKEAKQ